MVYNQKKYENVIDISDVLRGYTDFKKVRDAYIDIKKRLGLEIPVLKSADPLITITDPNYRGKSYRWEMYQKEGTNLLFEIYGEINTYSNDWEHNGLDLSEEKSIAQQLKISILPMNTELSDIIKNVLKKYPEREYEKRA